MAQHADPTHVRKPGPRPKYPWHQWMDGEWWHLTMGADYETSTRSFRSVAHSHGVRHGYRLHTRLTDGGIYIRFASK